MLAKIIPVLTDHTIISTCSGRYPARNTVYLVNNISVTSMKINIKGRWRKIITGNADKRVRDHIQEYKDKPYYAKLIDKFAFTSGVLNIPICQYLLLNCPQYFWIWYSFVIPGLLYFRLQYYKKINFHYFLFDFCYFTQLCNLLSLYVLPYSSTLFKIVFIYSNGPLMWAIVVWRCSLVFHDYDKWTTLYVHILPAMLSYALRWHSERGQTAGAITMLDFWLAVAGYLLWQTAYYVKTEVLDRDILDSHPEILTSLRWLSTDKKNAFARGLLKVFRRVGVMRPDEDYCPTSLKTKIIFMSSQFVYTLFTFLPTLLCYTSKRGHMVYIIAIFIISVYFGASYYIEIFSTRYQLQFHRRADVQKVVQAAAEIAYDAVEAAGATPTASGNDGDTFAAHTPTASARATAAANAIADSPAPPATMDTTLPVTSISQEPSAPASIPSSPRIHRSTSGVSATSAASATSNPVVRDIIHAATTAFVEELLHSPGNLRDSSSSDGDSETWEEVGSDVDAAAPKDKDV